MCIEQEYLYIYIQLVLFLTVDLRNEINKIKLNEKENEILCSNIESL